MHPFRPRLSLAHKAELFGFSKWLFLTNLLQFVSLRAGDFIVGKLRGPYELGLFTMANELGSVPATEVVAPINRAAFPGYSRLASERARLIEVYLRVMGLIALVALPVGVGIALTAEIFVPLLLGPKWVGAIAMLQLLALAGAVLGLWSNTGYVFLALGQPRRVAMIESFRAITIVILLIGFLTMNVENGIGWAMLVAALAYATLILYLSHTDLEIRWQKAVAALWRPILGCACLYVTVISVQTLLAPPSTIVEQVLVLILSIAAGAAVYAASVLGAWRLRGAPPVPEAYALELVRKWR